MARQAPNPEQPPAFDFKAIKERFFALNKARLARTLNELRQRQREFIELLPLLFHTNHPILPGYVSKATPAGIPDYSPPSATLNLAKKMAKSFSYKRRAYRRYYIDAIYMMGSTGTIAYSNKSDFDIWICYDDELKPEQVEALQRKAKAIEEWAQSMDVDAHLFLVNPTNFRESKHDALTSESSGTALHYLLLEEFYRTGLLLAGRYPVWWLVPPEQEGNYNEIVSDLKLKRYVHARDHIDFGGLDQFPAEEFYGATLWLLYKGINSPYKSILKTLLMEAYASEFPQIDILAVRFKQAIYNGENEINKLDPYLMMLHKVEEYLKQRSEHKRLDLLRRSFYFKVNEKLSEESNREHNWRRELLIELTQAWGWTTSQMFLLDSKENWKIQRVIAERNELMHEFTHSYRFLSDFARNHSESNLIDAKELNLLGRKLYSAFERKAGKIDIIYRGITQNLYETHISLHRMRSAENNDVWVIFNGIVNEQEVGHYPPLKRAYSIVELLAWCYFNKIITSNTTIAIYAQNCDITDKEVSSIVSSMEKAFDHDLLEADNLNDLRRPATVKMNMTVINAGVDPFAIHSRRGEHLTSNRTDSLRYGGRLENLTNIIEQVIVTSWHEVLTVRYTGAEGLFKCMQDYLQWQPPSRRSRPPSIKAVSFSSYRGEAIANRIELLFQTIMDCFYGDSHPASTLFVMAIEWDYYLLTMQDDYLQYKKAGDLQSLRNLLSVPSPNYKHVVFDPQTLHDDVLPTLYTYNKPDVIQIYFQIIGKNVHTYILDEKGSLFLHQTQFFDAISLVTQYEAFLQSVTQRMQYLRDGQANGTQVLKYVFYYIEKDHDGIWRIIRHRSNKLFKPNDYINIQVIIDKVDDEVCIKAYCNDQEFSSIDYADHIYHKLAEYILKLRHRHEKYPIYITDIDLSKSLLGPDSANVQTVHYLNYKKHIENKLLEIIQNQK